MQVNRHGALRLGVYSQHFEGILPFEQTPSEYLERSFGVTPQTKARGMLVRSPITQPCLLRAEALYFSCVD